MRILSVDDDAHLLELEAEFFEDLGYEFHGVGSQLEAQPLLHQMEFDAALIDYHLAESTGRLLCAAIMRSHPKTKVVVITADHAPETERAVYDLGVKHLLHKPFRFRQLLDILEQGSDDVALGPRLTIYQSAGEDEIDSLKRMLLADPSNGQVKWLLAFTFYKASKYGDAAHLLKEILRADPRSKLALYYLGACQYRFGLYEDAIKSWEKLTEVDPGGPMAKKAVEHLERARYLAASG